MSYKLFVDFREKHTTSDRDVVDVLTELKIPFELKQLDVGDFLIEDSSTGNKFCVERKIISDFVGSIYDGRLDKELFNMEANYTQSFLVVVGDWKEYNKQQSENFAKGFVKGFFTLEQRLGKFASILCRYKNIKLYQAADDKEFIKLLLKLAEKSTDGKLIGEVHLSKAKTKEKIYLNILTSFPNVGSDKAEDIMKVYPTFSEFYERVINGSFEGTVKGVGKKTTQVFEGEFL